MIAWIPYLEIQWEGSDFVEDPIVAYLSEDAAQVALDKVREKRELRLGAAPSDYHYSCVEVEVR